MSEVHVDVEGRTLRLTNLDKVLYPRTGTTKGEILNYYARIAPVLLPHLAGPGGDPDPVAARRAGGQLLREERPGRDTVVGADRHRADDRLASPLEERRHPGLPDRRRTWPRSPGWSTSPRSSSTSTSGPWGATVGPATPTGW